MNIFKEKLKKILTKFSIRNSIQASTNYFYIMEQILKIDDSALLSKRVVCKKDILHLLPKDMQESVEEICVLVNDGLPRWFIFLWGEGAYVYKPHSGVMEYDPYAKMVSYGRIYLYRKGRYLRVVDGSIKTFSVYLCRPHHMVLWREVKEYWMFDEAGVAGYSTTCKWFRRYK